MRVKFNRFKAPKPSSEVLDKYLINFPGIAMFKDSESLRTISSPELFGNDHPLSLDLGCGQGEFLVDLARRNPDQNFVGFDRHWKSLYLAVAAASEANLMNIKFVRQDLRFGVKKVLDNSVKTVYLLFPPPPTKNGLVKKEFVTSQLFRDIFRVLELGGELYFGSDQRDYFREKIGVINQVSGFKDVSNNNAVIHTRFSRIWTSLGIQPQIKVFCKLL